VQISKLITIQLTPHKLEPSREIKKGLSYQGMGFLLTPLITCILTGRTDTFCVTQHQETKEIDTKDNLTLQNYMLFIFLKFYSK